MGLCPSSWRPLLGTRCAPHIRRVPLIEASLTRGETMVMRITAARGPRKAKGDKPAGEKKARKKGGRKNKGGAPENM